MVFVFMQTPDIFSELCWSWKSTGKHFVRLVVLIIYFFWLLTYYYVQLFLQRDSQRYSVKFTVFFYCFLQKGVLLWSPLSEGWQRTFWRLKLPSCWRVIYTILCIYNISHLVMRNVWRWCLVFCTPPFLWNIQRNAMTQFSLCGLFAVLVTIIPYILYCQNYSLVYFHMNTSLSDIPSTQCS